ncbi:hypothetical protein [Pseudoramibacter alactolyticus]
MELLIGENRAPITSEDIDHFMAFATKALGSLQDLSLNEDERVASRDALRRRLRIEEDRTRAVFDQNSADVNMLQWRVHRASPILPVHEAFLERQVVRIRELNSLAQEMRDVIAEVKDHLQKLEIIAYWAKAFIDENKF